MTDNRIANTPPRSYEAERSIIASMVIDSTAIDKVIQIVERDDFYLESHKIIFSTILDLRNAGQPVDIITVNEELRASNTIDKIGGIDVLAELIDSTPTIANISYYCSKIKKYSKQRNIINACSKVIDSAYDQDISIEDLIDQISLEIMNPIYNDKQLFQTKQLKHLLTDTLDYIEEMFNGNNEIRGVPTGLTDIDQITSGFQKSDLITIAARPGMGKTTFALNIAKNASGDSIRQGINHKVLFISLEMPILQIVMKLFSMTARVEQFKLKNGKLKAMDFANITEHSLKLKDYPLWINDTPSLKIGQIKAIARQQKYQHGLDCLIVDYLGRITEDREWSNRSRSEAVGNISRELKSLARELNIPIIMLSQLNRKIEERSNRQPLLSDLRESGNIEQDSDIIMFLYSGNQGEYSGTPDSEIIKCDISKHRNGSPAYGIDLFFNKSISCFENAVKNTY